MRYICIAVDMMGSGILIQTPRAFFPAGRDIPHERVMYRSDVDIKQ